MSYRITQLPIPEAILDRTGLGAFGRARSIVWRYLFNTIM